MPNCRCTLRMVSCCSLVLVVSVISAIGIAFYVPRMAPVRQGNSQAFWKIATGVSLTPDVEDNLSGEAYLIDGTWAAYDSSHLHGSNVYRVSRADVLADLNAVVSILAKDAQTSEDTAVLRAFREWYEEEEYANSDSVFLELIKRERNKSLTVDGVTLLSHRIANEQQFWRRWERADCYWASVVFEWMFFTGLAVFSVWPAIRHLSAWRWSVHASLLPFLFMLPAYLGYSTFTFTSAGPSGGILYPHLLVYCRGGSMNSADEWMLQRTPQILEPLSTPIGLPFMLTGLGMPGPTSTIVAGAVAGAAASVITWIVGRWQNRHRQGQAKE